MKRTSWLNGFLNSMRQQPRRRMDSTIQQRGVLTQMESLESRQLLSTTALFIPETGELNIEIGTDDNIRLRAQNGNVRVEEEQADGSFTQISSVGTLSAALVRSIVIVGGDDANEIDASGVIGTSFPTLELIDVDAGNGHDTILGSPDLNNSLNGGHGDDTIVGQDGDDTLIGNDGNDSIAAGTGDDSIRGGDGHDFIDAGIGNDSISAGDGTDTVLAGDGHDSVFAGNGQDFLVGEAGNDTLNGDGGFDTIHGGDGNDSLLGGELNDLVIGDAGDDFLSGQGGNDTLIGVIGADRADGGAGEDLIQSALDAPVDDPAPAPAAAPPVAPDPLPLPDAVDSGIGADVGTTVHTISSGTGDGSLLVQVTATGAFGTGRIPTISSVGATLDPVGPVGISETTVDSQVYFRSSTLSGPRNTLENLAVNVSNVRGASNRANSVFDTEASSTFEIGALQFALTQTADPIFDILTGQQIGALLTQTYRITNTGAVTTDFELSRFLDGTLQVDGSTTNGGGRLVSSAGDEFLFETDAGGLAANTTFVGITAKGGTIPLNGRFEIDQVPDLQTSLVSGLDLDEQIRNDINADQAVDTDYNVSMSFRNVFNLAAGATATYTTHTVFGSGTPDDVQFNLKPVAVDDAGRVLTGRDIAVDVVSNDFDADGALVYSTVEIAVAPDFGTAVPLADGRIRYIPNAGFSGTDVFSYTIADNLGVRSNIASVVMTVNALDTIGDSMNGGTGNDTILGSDGNDTIFGGAGQDSMLGALGNDRISGQGGNDSLNGGGGADTLDGGDGDDLVRSLVGGAVVVPSISITDLTIAEGNTGTQLAVVTIVLSEATTVPVSMLASTADNEAQAGNDFTTVTTLLTIAPGATVGTVAIPIVGDTVYEVVESFFVNLSAPVNGVFVDSQATVTITDSDVTAATQAVFVDFATGTTGADHVYTATEQAAIVARLQTIYSEFPVTFTSVQPVAGTLFNTIGINLPPAGGLAAEIDFRNLNLVSSATVDINTFLGGAGEPAATSANFVELTTKVIAHENGHLMGLRHNDSFGPIGSGISPGVLAADFNPTYPGPSNATESTQHIMGSPASTGETLFDAISGQYFGEREAVKLSTWAFRGAITPEQAPGHGSIATAQPIQLRELYVPNTLPAGTTNADRAFRVNQLTVTGAINTQGERDVYSFSATAGQLLNFEVISSVLSRNTDTIDPQIRILDVSGTEIAYYGANAFNDDSTDSGFPDLDSMIIDLQIAATGMYYIEVSTPANTLAGEEIGNYELYMYDFTTYTPAVGGTGTGGTGVTIMTDPGDVLVGGNGNDTVAGAEGNDTINGQGGNDSLLGGDGNDSILGGSGIDTLFGGAGNDTLDGQGGDDELEGGEGDDIALLTFGGGNDTVSNTGGLDVATVNADNTANVINVSQSAVVGQAFNKLVVSLGTASLTVDGSVQYTVVNALGGNDTVNVASLNNVSGSVLTVNGGDGNDFLNAVGAKLGNVRMRMNGQAGNDSLDGSLSGETLDAGDGEDSVCGFAGNDTILGGTGDDSLGGSLGDDIVNGGDGADLINGQLGNDNLFGDLGNDTLKGDEGHDTLFGGAGDDNLNGMIGNDSLLGGVGKDGLAGGAGNDTLDGGRNDDSIGGSTGDDLIRGDHGHDQINAGDGNNTVIGGDGNDTIAAGLGNDFVHGGDGNDRIGTDGGDDVIVGGDGSDILNAGGGQDIVLGGDGDDTINGQGGTDTIAGNQGVDFISDPLTEIDEAFALSDLLLAAFQRL